MSPTEGARHGAVVPGGGVPPGGKVTRGGRVGGGTLRPLTLDGGVMVLGGSPRQAHLALFQQVAVGQLQLGHRPGAPCGSQRVGSLARMPAGHPGPSWRGLPGRQPNTILGLTHHQEPGPALHHVQLGAGHTAVVALVTVV